MFRPAYLELTMAELRERADKALALLAHCDLCPRGCGVDRLSGEDGFCRTGRKAVIASYNLHFGEEAPLVGDSGSGTIFFAGCNLGCMFCQNMDISQPEQMAEAGLEATPEELAGVMLELQAQGALNINLVTPSHVAAQILEALPLAVEHGLTQPLVWNSSGYDSLEVLRLLDGVVDIYMPDVKVWDPETAEELLSARDYPQRAREGVAEMHGQVGDLVLDGNGIAVHGLLVRHLVLPHGLAGTRQWMEFLAGLSKQTYVNVMDQYRPCGRAMGHHMLGRMPTQEEYVQAMAAAQEAGLARLDDRNGRFAYRIARLLH